jgi:hypothetical protein
MAGRTNQPGIPNMTPLMTAVALTGRHAQDARPKLAPYMLRGLLTLAGLVGLFLLAGI